MRGGQDEESHEEEGEVHFIKLMKQFRSVSQSNGRRKFDALMTQIRSYQQSEQKAAVTRPHTTTTNVPPQRKRPDLPRKFKYSLDDPWVDRLYPRQALDAKFEFVKTRERAILRSS